MTKFIAVIAVLIASAAGAVTAIALDGNENPTRARAGTATTELAIAHVRTGCHVWSKGSLKGVAMRLGVKRGADLRITNRDVVPHQLVQLAGPKLRLEGHMMTGKTQLVSFKQPGDYHFTTKVIEMGPPANTETTGPDNALHLTVSVG